MAIYVCMYSYVCWNNQKFIIHSTHMIMFTIFTWLNAAVFITLVPKIDAATIYLKLVTTRYLKMIFKPFKAQTNSGLLYSNIRSVLTKLVE